MTRIAQIEVTDTYGGEANYCWVKRGTTNRQSRRGIIEAVKELAGWHRRCRVRVHDYGDMMEIRPTKSIGICQIAFVTWGD